jgi:hypothetical protein
MNHLQGVQGSFDAAGKNLKSNYSLFVREIGFLSEFLINGISCNLKQFQKHISGWESGSFCVIINAALLYFLFMDTRQKMLYWQSGMPVR